MKSLRHCLFLFWVCYSIFPISIQAEPLHLPKVETYQQLVTAIRETKAATSNRIEQAVEREKVREAWLTGKLINEHVLFQKRADYDKQVVEKLAADLNMDRSELYRMVEFAKSYPIVVPARQLSWSHYQVLLSLNDPKERESLEEQAEKENWGRDRVREEVRKRKTNRQESEIPKKIPVTPAGEPFVYRIVKGLEKDELVIDLGFSNYLHFDKLLIQGPPPFKEKDIVRLENGKNLRKIKDAAEKDLFTYKIKVIEIIDGDTLKAAVDLGFGITTVQTLRLRAIDAPEILTSDGKEAKEFLESVIASEATQSKNNEIASSQETLLAMTRNNTPIPVLIRSVKSDKYDRYLIDLFVNGEFINQKLVDSGLATVVGES